MSNRFARPRSGFIPYLPPYTPEIRKASEYLGDRAVPGCPARGITDCTEPYEGTVIEQTGPVSIIGRGGEKVTGR